jgi:hypothetical protein
MKIASAAFSRSAMQNLLVWVGSHRSVAPVISRPCARVCARSDFEHTARDVHAGAATSSRPVTCVLVVHMQG